MRVRISPVGPEAHQVFYLQGWDENGLYAGGFTATLTLLSRILDDICGHPAALDRLPLWHFVRRALRNFITSKQDAGASPDSPPSSAFGPAGILLLGESATQGGPNV